MVGERIVLGPAFLDKWADVLDHHASSLGGARGGRGHDPKAKLSRDTFHRLYNVGAFASCSSWWRSTPFLENPGVEPTEQVGAVSLAHVDRGFTFNRARMRRANCRSFLGCARCPVVDQGGILQPSFCRGTAPASRRASSEHGTANQHKCRHACAIASAVSLMTAPMPSFHERPNRLGLLYLQTPWMPELHGHLQFRGHLARYGWPPRGGVHMWRHE